MSGSESDMKRSPTIEIAVGHADDCNCDECMDFYVTVMGGNIDDFDDLDMDEVEEPLEDQDVSGAVAPGASEEDRANALAELVHRFLIELVEVVSGMPNADVDTVMFSFAMIEQHVHRIVDEVDHEVDIMDEDIMDEGVEDL